ncbi:helix-turn-helix domain-containing protein [Pseudomonas sp. URIL14HWK12:I5]|uniref:helix-turn-helix domain-containing protein n=1 Tax=Pseudomonas sp. URIL14HWK12:I5 TaxID=1261630 RepID=UPI0009D8C176|nr:helix-turn-helix domain-containing protein [Pseudomonas sp. URIL14HWK12:I5]SMD13865.1 Transcriptional regulators [Pseudomonas sp. URIL14HWK12:I5]
MTAITSPQTPTAEAEPANADETNVSSANDASAPPKESKKVLEKKWGKSNIAAGWTCIPNILIKRQVTLGLDAVDLNILLHLLTYWWEDENHPHPSKDTLAKAMGISASTVQRRIRAMEAGKLIKRVVRPRAKDRNDTNLYDLTPLKMLLEPHAKVELEERAASHANRRKRMTTVTKAVASK